MTGFKSLGLGVVCSLAFTCAASANAIIIYGTGESAGLTALSVGQSDPNYDVVAAPSGSGATLGRATTTAANPNWVQNNASGDWISPGASGVTNWAPGMYEYQTSFDLTGLNPSTAELTGSWASDNNGCIYLNNVSTGVCTAAVGGFKTLTSFTITSGFVAGVNYLDFVIMNTGTSDSPAGMFLEISGTASTATVNAITAVPEPPMFPALAGIGLIGLAFALRQGRKSRA
jgi:hypothetical protein